VIRALAQMEALGRINGVDRTTLDDILEVLRDSLELKEKRPFRDQDPGPVAPPPLLNP